MTTWPPQQCNTRSPAAHSHATDHWLPSLLVTALQTDHTGAHLIILVIIDSVVQANHEIPGGDSDAGHGVPIIVPGSWPGPGVRGWPGVSPASDSHDHDGDKGPVISASNQQIQEETAGEEAIVPVENVLSM